MGQVSELWAKGPPLLVGCMGGLAISECPGALVEIAPLL